ncbi:DUF5805 domain-containing protein [Halorubrum ezzemoulense]|uniref:DUF5805 domain-containing protein n=1 Tax=Halorubrum ezzemoulense TaxID=337243 RepID=UPI00232C2574|nr:DUF5805 domain-containing protein [Halorubrum ezzemoulense]MDB2243020.1 DUF5805 domain-containing protein [Halorubrum ezzemoulense]
MSETKHRFSISCTEEEYEKWQEMAEENGEHFRTWVRMMIRSGSRLWNADEVPFNPDGLKQKRATSGDADTVKDTVEKNLSVSEPQTIEELADLVIQDVEDEVGTALEELQEEGAVKFAQNDGKRGFIRDER